MSTPVDDLKRVMANKTDMELYDVLHGHTDDFTADAIEAAKQEFASRNLETPVLSSLSTAVEEKKRVEEAPFRVASQNTFLFHFYGVSRHSSALGAQALR